MNDGIRSFVVQMPWKKPIPSPIAIAIATVGSAVQRWST